jgi:23S rRNA-intervening sequence protein
MQDYRKLGVWQKSHKLTLDTYAVSPYFKAPEAWPVRDQMLRAAISIPSNIAEGAAGQTQIFGDFCSIPWVPAMNLSMISFLRGISASYRSRCTWSGRGKSQRSGEGYSD